MINILKKIPIFEIIYILGLNFLFICMNIFLFFFVTLPDGTELSKKISILDLSSIAAYVIIAIYFYLILSQISVNKLFCKFIHYIKFNANLRWIIYVLLCVISPTFSLCLSSSNCRLIILGSGTSLAFPLMLIYGYWGLEKYISGIWKRAYKLINILLTIAISFFTAGFVYFLNNQLSYGDTGALEVLLYIITVVTGVLLLLTNESKILLDKIKKYKWHCLFLWMSVIYASMWGIRNEWLNYYVIYISMVLLIMLVFEKPILRLKAKNTELRREAEVLYRR